MKRLIGLVAILLAASPAWGAIAHVRSASGFTGATSATSVSTGAMVNTAGDFLYAPCRAGSLAVAINSVTDTAGNTYTAVDAGTTTGDGSPFRAFYALNIATASANVITCTIQASTTNVAILVDEYSGVATTAALCTSTTGNTGTTSATSFTSAAFSTCEGGDLIAVGATIQSHGLTFTAGTNYTLEQSANGQIAEEDQIPAGVLTNTTASMTVSTAKPWGWTVAVFKVPAVAAGCTDFLMLSGFGHC